MDKNKERPGNSAWLIELLWKGKWFVIIATIAGALIAYTAASLMPVKYKAVAEVYAAGYDQNNKMLMKEGNPMLLITFLQSSYLKDSVIRSFDLAKHYGIDTTTAEGKSALSKEFNANIDFERTINKSVKIIVKDRDPEFAARLANGIVAISNHIKQMITQNSTSAALETLRANYLQKKQEVDSLASKLSRIKAKTIEMEVTQLQLKLRDRKAEIADVRKKLQDIREQFKVHDLNQYMNEVQSAYTKARSEYQLQNAKLKIYREQLTEKDSARIRTAASVEGLTEKMMSLQTKLDELNKASGDYDRLNNELALQISLRDNLEWRLSHLSTSLNPDVKSLELEQIRNRYKDETDRLGEIRKEYEEALATFHQPLPAAYLISKAGPDYQPAYPKTWLITLAGMILMFVFSISLLMIRYQFMPPQSS